MDDSDVARIVRTVWIVGTANLAVMCLLFASLTVSPTVQDLSLAAISAIAGLAFYYFFKLAYGSPFARRIYDGARRVRGKEPVNWEETFTERGKHS